MDIEIKTIVSNLKTMVGEFPIKAKDFQAVVLPISVFLNNLESGKWRVVEDVPTDQNTTPVV